MANEMRRRANARSNTFCSRNQVKSQQFHYNALHYFTYKTCILLVWLKCHVMICSIVNNRNGAVHWTCWMVILQNQNPAIGSGAKCIGGVVRLLATVDKCLSQSYMG